MLKAGTLTALFVAAVLMGLLMGLLIHLLQTSVGPLTLA